MRVRRLTIAFLFALSASGCNCGTKPHVFTVSENGTVVQGNPSVETGKPKVSEEAPQTPEFKLNVPRQCDFFQQNAVRKVDILWVVDNSGSMKTSQANLASEFPKFLTSLLSLLPPVDFHIGVTSTDVDNVSLVFDATRDAPIPPSTTGTSGALHGFDLTKDGGSAGRYIACNEKGDCNVPKTDPAGKIDAAAAFQQMSKTGTAGSPVERGLQASYLALTRDDNLHAEAPASTDISKRFPFIRPDAALFVIYVSDEDDSSCSPLVDHLPNGHPSDPNIVCTTDPGCRCDVTKTTWGSPQYFTRFLESYKGFGHGDLVAAGAVVCTEQQVVGAQNGDPNFAHYGCPDKVPAYYGDRYIQVAAATGGTAISIRGNFANALQSLGFAVSGLRKDFRLSRGPFTDTLEVYLTPFDAADCTDDTGCDAGKGQKCRGNKCATLQTVNARSLGDCTPPDVTPRPDLEYCKCDSSAFRNIMRFNQTPPAQSAIEVCYDVNSNFNQVCQ